MSPESYIPTDWHWIVAGDESRFWSSAAGAYVGSLPQGAVASRIGSEAELTELLAGYQLPGPTYPAYLALAELHRLLAAATAPILAAYPEAERLAWDAKEAEAAGFMADPEPAPATYPLLRGEVAAELGIAPGAVSVEQIATKAEAVLWLASQWRSLVSRLSGVRKRAAAAIAVAENDAGRRAAVLEVAAAISGS